MAFVNFNWGWSAKGDNPNRKTSILQDCWGLGVGMTIPPRLRNIVTKSEEVKTGLICQGRHRKGLKDLRAGSWNVLSLYQSGALKLLLSQLDSYKMDITAIQDMRWIGEGIIDKRYHTIFYSCARLRHMFGTGFLGNKRIKHLVTVFRARTPEYARYVLEDCSSTAAVRGLFINCRC
jgi:hypothetical protein